MTIEGASQDLIGFALNEVMGASKRLTTWPYVAAAVLFALYAWWRDRATPLAADGILGYLVPRAVFLHPSATFDYRYFLFDRGLVTLLYAGVLILLGKAAQGDAVPLIRGFGEAAIGVTLGYTIAIVVAHDLGKFLAHYIEHFVPFFWQFHRLHHSAHTLTPVTNYRSHPVDRILNALMTLTIRSGVTALFVWAYPGELTVMAILGVNLGQIAFNLAASNLRHSHIWISFGPRLEHLFISPAQHQIHHSSADRHLDTNMGFQFAVWDWIAGTLYVPKGRETFDYGLKGEDWSVPTSLWDAYTGPFKRLKNPEYRALRRAPDFE